jgi:hypothetical protein
MWVAPWKASGTGMFSSSSLQIHDIYRDRMALEREYASKIQLLVKKATEKKNKVAGSLVAGNSPTKPCSDSTVQQKLVLFCISHHSLRLIKSSTLVNAYAEIIASMSKVAQDHLHLADIITAQVTEPLKALERRNDNLKKKVRAVRRHLLHAGELMCLTAVSVLSKVVIRTRTLLSGSAESPCTHRFLPWLN